jgi:hypothetical protein
MLPQKPEALGVVVVDTIGNFYATALTGNMEPDAIKLGFSPG